MASASEVHVAAAPLLTPDAFRRLDVAEVAKWALTIRYITSDNADILVKNEIRGEDLLDRVTTEGLERWGMPGGPAGRIMGAVAAVKTEAAGPSSSGTGGRGDGGGACELHHEGALSSARSAGPEGRFGFALLSPLHPDDAISRTVSLIRAGSVITLPSGHLKLLTGAWPGATSGELFLRPCYAALFDHILKKCVAGGNLDHQLRECRHLITGQPGTGKSVLLWYFAFRLLTEQTHRSVVLVDGPKKVVAVLQPDGGTFAFPFDKLHELRYVRDLIDPVILCDSHLPVIMAFPTIVVTSPGSLARGDQAIRKEFMPPIHLPVPSCAEVQALRALAFSDMSVDDVNCRMSLWGPIARFVLVRVAPAEQQAQWGYVQQVSLDNIDRVIRGTAVLSSAGAGDGGDATHRIVLEHAACHGAAPDSPAADPSRWQYYQRGPVVVASDAILRWLLDRMVAEQNWNAAFLVDVSARIAPLGAVRGLTFERLALALLRQGGEFRIRRLRGTAVSEVDAERAVVSSSARYGAASVDDAAEPGDEPDGSGSKRRRTSLRLATRAAPSAAAGSGAAFSVDVETGESLLEVPQQEAHEWRLAGDLVGLAKSREMMVPQNSNAAGLDALMWLPGLGHHAPIDCTVSASHGLHQRGAALAIEALGWSVSDGWPRTGLEGPTAGEAEAASAEALASARRAMQVHYYWVVPEDVFPLWSRPQPAKRGTDHAGLALNLAQFALCIPQLLRFQAMQGVLSEDVPYPDQILAELTQADAPSAGDASSGALPGAAGTAAE